MMKLLVGLGNPGKDYARNRHNIGFMVLNEIAKAHNFAPWRSRFKGETSEGLIEGQKCLLLKPLTFMNLSGESVQAAASFYKIDLADIIVFHDEIDLPPAKVKIKIDGGNAGHNGLKSISQHVGNAYMRVRLGVGRPQQKSQVANFVLKDFAKDDADWLEDELRSIGRNIGSLVNGKNSDFIKELSDDLSLYNPKPKKIKETPPKKKKVPSDKTEVSSEANVHSQDNKSSKSSTAKAGNHSALGDALNKWLKKGD